MNRIDLYTLIHKAQRAHLFALSTRIGHADFSDSEETRAIEEELRKMIAHLKGHSHTEATFIHPLYNEIGNQIAQIDHEHEDLEEELNKLERILDKKQWPLLYPEFNRFIASYLTHQDEEERMQEDVLWKYFDDNRLAAVMTAFRMSRTPIQAKEDLKILFLGLSVLELAKIFQNIRASAPAEVFHSACQMAKEELEPNRWIKLENTLA